MPADHADEIGRLERQFTVMGEQLAEAAVQRQAHAERNARLAERSRISRDLHDSVKQHLFALGMQIGVARARLPPGGEATRQHLRHAEALVAQAQSELAALIHELRPIALVDQHLGMAVQAYCSSWSEQYGISIHVQSDDTYLAPSVVEATLLRILQEALANWPAIAGRRACRSN